MSETAMRIIFVNEGPAVSTEPGASPQELPPGPRAPRPEERVSRGPPASGFRGGPDSVGEGPSRGPRGSDAIMAELKRAATTAADALGAGGLATKAVGLAESFQRIMGKIDDAARRVSPPRPAPSFDSSQLGEPPAGPAAPPTPLAPNGLPIVGPRPPGPTAPPIVTRFAPNGLPIVGPRAMPPTAGPSAAAVAGSGSSAAMMARLAAAAGPAAIALVGVAAGAAAAKAAFDRLSYEATRLEGYSAELSAATGIASVRAEMADLRRAQRIGPGLAVFTDLKGQANEHLADLVTSIESRMTDAIVENKELLQGLVNLLGLGVAELQALIASNKVLFDAMIGRFDLMGGDLKDVVKANGKVAKAFERFMEGDATEIEDDPFMAAFLAAVAAPPERGKRPVIAGPVIMP